MYLFWQTWEDPGHVDGSTGVGGDNDPIDVIEIGGAVHSRGSVIQVKVLGVLAMIDDGETDWKVFCIDVNDPDSDKLNDIEGKKKIQFTLGFRTIIYSVFFEFLDPNSNQFFRLTRPDFQANSAIFFV